MCISKKLNELRNNMVVNKSRYNKHGGFNYRSLDDIYVAIKPKLSEMNLELTVDTDMIMVGSNMMMKAIVSLTDVGTKEKIVSNGFALHALEQKGMNSAQVSGSTSSYCIKYALSSLLLLDDETDPDSLDNSQSTKPTPTYKPSNKTVSRPVEATTTSSCFDDEEEFGNSNTSAFDEEEEDNIPFGKISKINGFEYKLINSKNGACWILMNLEDTDRGAKKFEKYGS